MSIPKILHQTWKSDDIPDAFADYVSSWKENHPDWEYRLWTDNENRKFIASNYSWFLKTYDEYPWPIQRADAIRYFILHKYGGLYADLDFVSCKPIDPLLFGRQSVLGLEPEEHCREFDVPKIICNALMATTPDHPFFESVIQRLPEFSVHTDNDQAILNTTGPFMLTRVYDEFDDKDSVDLIPSKYLYPLNKDQANQLIENDQVDVDFSEAYAIHLHYGSWWKPERQKELGTFVEPRMPSNLNRISHAIATTIASIKSIIGQLTRLGFGGYRK